MEPTITAQPADHRDTAHLGNFTSAHLRIFETALTDWRLATTPPTTLAGVVAVLRFANQIEDEGLEWSETDTIGAEGWHYQLRATMAEAIEAIIRRGA